MPLRRSRMALLVGVLSCLIEGSCQTASSGRSGSLHPGGPHPGANVLRADRTPRGRPAPTALEPVVLVAGRPGGIRPSILFRRGLVALAQNRPGQARYFFDRIVTLFPKWHSAATARYNAAVATERLGAFVEAARRYNIYARAIASAREKAVARLRRGYCLLRARRFSAAIEVLRFLENQSDLTPQERLEASIYQARALLAQKRPEQADKVLRRGQWLTKVAGSSGGVRAMAAQVAFLLGRTAEIEMDQIVLSACDRPFGRLLFDKGALLDQARKRYYRVVRFGEPVWSSAALDRVGAMIEAFYWAVVRAPLPQFTPVLFYDGSSGRWKHLAIWRQRVAYERFIVRRLRSSVKTALEIYERRVGSAGLASRWLAGARDRIRTLHRLVKELRGQRLGAGRPCRRVRNFKPHRMTGDPLWSHGCQDRFLPFVIKPPL